MITEDYPPHEASGIARHVAELADALAKLGVHVTLLVPGSGDTALAEPLQVPVAAAAQVPSPTVIRAGAVPRFVHAPSPGRMPFNLPVILHHNVEMISAVLALGSMSEPLSRPDLIHAHDIFAAPAAYALGRVYGVPVVFTKHFWLPAPDRFNLDPLEEHARRDVGYLFELQAWSVGQAARVIAVSRFVRDRLVAAAPTVVKHLDVIGAGSDYVISRRSVSPALARQRLRERLPPAVDSGALLLLQVGRLKLVKGPDISIRALALLGVRRPGLKSHLVLVGAGSDRAMLVDMAAALGVSNQVHFLGFESDRSALAEIYLACDAVLVPSRVEAFGLQVAEAITLHRPIIAAQVGGIVEQVEHRLNGLLYAPGDDRESAERMADLILWAVDQPDHIARIAAHGPLSPSAYSWQRIAAATATAYLTATTAAGVAYRGADVVAGDWV